MIYKRFSIILLILVVFLAGCPHHQALTPVAEMTPEQKAAWFMSVYNKQYDLYLVEVANPTLTEEQKTYLRSKRDLLEEVEPLIALYNSYVEMGSIATPETEQQIILLINKLLMKAL